MTAPDRTRRARRPRLRVAGLVVGCLAVTWLVAAVAVLGFPRTDEVSAEAPADAVVALGGRLGEATVDTALEVARTSGAEVLVVSRPYTDDEPQNVADLCDGPVVDGLEVLCPVPDPSTTQGEARIIARLADQRGWERVAVVTPTYHVARSELVVRRCYSGELAMVDAEARISPVTWAYYTAYQTGAFAKALLVTRSC